MVKAFLYQILSFLQLKQSVFNCNRMKEAAGYSQRKKNLNILIFNPTKIFL